MSYLMSERNFRRNEEYIRRIVDFYPQVIRFKLPVDIKQTEVLARNIRYAGKSLMEQQWTTTMNFVKFLQIWDDVSVSPSLSHDEVVCGPESAIRTLAGTSCLPIEGAPDQPVPKIQLDEQAPADLVNAVLVLHHYGYLSEPSVITTKLDLQAMIDTNKYDIGLQRNGDTYTVL